MRPKLYFLLPLVLISLLVTACQAKKVCPPGSVTYVDDPSVFPTLAAPGSLAPPTPSVIQIGSRQVTVDRVVQGPLCNDAWSGTVYVACNVQVAAWSTPEAPAFLENCSLAIEPDTVVYVAAHNNAPYYKGCSCHIGKESK